MTDTTAPRTAAPDIAELRELAEKARVSADRPLELYCAHGVGWEDIVFERHTVFGGHIDEEDARCRVTTGTEFDEHEMAEYVIAAANAVPALLEAIEPLLALVRAALELQEARVAYALHIARGPVVAPDEPNFEPWERMRDAEWKHNAALAALPESVRVAARKP